MSNLSPKPFSYMPIKVTVVDRVTIGNQRYRLSRHHAGQVVVETIEEMPRFESFTELEFYEKHACGEIKIEENYFSQHRKTPDVHPGWLFTDYSPKKQAKALFYEQLIQAYENLSTKEGGLKRTVDELGPRMASLALEALSIVGKMQNGGGSVRLQRIPSVGHFNKMYRLFKDSGGRTISLISKDEGPKRTYRIDPESLAVWEEYAEGYATDGRPTVKKQHLLLLAAIDGINKARALEGKHRLLAPSYKVFAKIIKGLGAYHIHHGRYGKASADKKFGFTRGGFGFFRPGERVDIDEKRMDLMALFKYADMWEKLTDDEKNEAKRIRLWVVVAIDIATRYILGMRFCTKPNSKTTLEVIRMVMEDKSEISAFVGAQSQWIGYCRPERFYTDSGSALVNDEVAPKIAECEIGHARPTAGTPQARGHVESSFRGHQRIVSFYQGRTFKDVVEKADADPVKEASVPIDRIEREYLRAILDIYHNTPHEGLGGETPHNAWVRQTQLYKMRPLIEPDVKRHIFGLDEVRTLGPEGLRFLGVNYHSPVLAKWHLQDGGVEVPIRVDVGNIRSISFKKDGHWYIADNQIGLPDDVSLPEWMAMWERVTREYAKSTTVTLDIFYAALRDLRESGEAAALRNPLGLRRVTMENVRSYERALLHKAGFTVQAALATPASLPAPVGRRSAFLSANAPGYNDIVTDAEALELAEKVARGEPATTKTPRTTTNNPVGTADDIQL